MSLQSSSAAVCKWQWRNGRIDGRRSCCLRESDVGREVTGFEVTREELKVLAHLLSGLICESSTL